MMGEDRPEGGRFSSSSSAATLRKRDRHLMCLIDDLEMLFFVHFSKVNTKFE